MKKVDLGEWHSKFRPEYDPKLIFQIIDDYLDEVGNYKKLGKTPGKDKKKGKSTILQHLKITILIS